ncbi:MAG: hypothetical protein AVDCRST_MAG53-192 [uncultured Solirubrobacteraceae bacterium]|uniref:Uncharacterized protein n=1 Tax=uncultured Solirubrobacteraceae bacterium TaxID=1162706 RepID=A0A6J4RMP8_9ACTN|nr:MAG: hypothetical protein AVDCRST_MAG53-192 [uncultured Solirubrobacteraceae bacterium]
MTDSGEQRSFAPAQGEVALDGDVAPPCRPRVLRRRCAATRSRGDGLKALRHG